MNGLDRLFLIYCGLGLFFIYGFTRRALAPCNAVTRFGLGEVNWRQRGACLLLGAFISMGLWIGFEWFLSDYYLYETISALPSNEGWVIKALLLVISGWAVWTLVLAEMFAYYLVGVRRRRERKVLASNSG